MLFYLFIYLFDRDNANKHSVKTNHVTEVLHIKFIAANFQLLSLEGLLYTIKFTWLHTIN